MDLEIREFSQTIINFVNGSNLPTEVKRLCLKDICNQLDGAAMQTIQAQAADRKRAEEKAKEKAKKEQEEKEIQKEESEELKPPLCPKEFLDGIKEGIEKENQHQQEIDEMLESLEAGESSE